jgi:hypothetical protein
MLVTIGQVEQGAGRRREALALLEHGARLGVVRLFGEAFTLFEERLRLLGGRGARYVRHERDNEQQGREQAHRSALMMACHSRSS